MLMIHTPFSSLASQEHGLKDNVALLVELQPLQQKQQKQGSRKQRLSGRKRQGRLLDENVQPASASGSDGGGSNGGHAGRQGGSERAAADGAAGTTCSIVLSVSMHLCACPVSASLSS